MSEYQFASEHAKHLDLSQQVAEASIEWQRAEAAMKLASSLWNTSRASGGSDEHDLYEIFRLREQARDGALASLALVTREMMVLQG